VTGGENRYQDVRAAKCWQRRAIQDRKKEKPQRSQVAEYRGEAAPTSWPRSLEENVQHGQYINFVGLFSEPASRLPGATPFNLIWAF
jgi:hypothetical protein